MAVSGKLQVPRLWRDCEGNNASMPQPRVLLASGLVNKINLTIQKEDKHGRLIQNGEQIPNSFEYFWLLDGTFNKIRYLAIMRRTTMVGSFKIFE